MKPRKREKECEDSLKLTNTIWGLKVNTLEQMYKHRDTDVTEKFGLWKSQVDGNMENYKTMRNLYDHMSEKLNETAFGLYKGQRDLYDTLNERYSNKFNELDKKVYGMEVANLYQNKIIQMGMDSVLKESVCYTDRKTCRAIYGVVGLPSTPAVSVLEAASASLPIPLPTKIPSVIINMAENTIPSTVGISNFRKSLGMFMVSKSMLSFIRFNVKNYSFYVNTKVRQR